MTKVGSWHSRVVKDCLCNVNTRYVADTEDPTEDFIGSLQGSLAQTY